MQKPEETFLKSPEHVIKATPYTRGHQVGATEDMTAGNTSPLTWRDIYRAVAESEVRIVAAINTSVAPLTADVQDHEARIRLLERGGSKQAQDAEAKATSLALDVAKVEQRVVSLENENLILETREKGILATLSAGQKTILLFAAAAGLISLAADFLARLVGGS